MSCASTWRKTSAEAAARPGRGPDADLLALRHSRQQWLIMAAGYVLQRFRCPPQLAAQLTQQVLDELYDEADPAEVLATPLSKVHPVPPALLPPGQRPPAA